MTEPSEQHYPEVRSIVFVGEYEMYDDYMDAEERAKELAESTGKPVHVANVQEFDALPGEFPIMRAEMIMHTTTGETGKIDA